jgi:hypothetical protein
VPVNRRPSAAPAPDQPRDPPSGTAGQPAGDARQRAAAWLAALLEHGAAAHGPVGQAGRPPEEGGVA